MHIAENSNQIEHFFVNILCLYILGRRKFSIYLVHLLAGLPDVQKPDYSDFPRINPSQDCS